MTGKRTDAGTGITSIARELQDLLQRQGLDEKLRDYRIWRIWDETVGPQIAARARPARIREGVLEVRVDRATWMQQLQLLKPKILSKLRESGGEGIKDIYLLRGKTEKAQETVTEKNTPSARFRQTKLTPEEQKRIENTVRDIPDADLQRDLKLFFSLQLRLSKARSDSS